MNDATTAKVLLTGLLAAGTALWGWFGWLVLIWAVCMVLDYLSGSAAALKAHEWSSQRAREGLWRKCGEILIVGVAALTDVAISLILRSGIIEFPWSYSVILTIIVLAWYTLTELGSILENATRLTDKVPLWLSKFLKITADTVDEAGKKLTGGEDDDDIRG